MKNDSESPLINFLGGKTSYYLIGLVALLAITIYLLNKISFIFHPFVVIFSTVLPPIVFALLLYYLFNPIVNLLSKKRLSRSLSIGLSYVVILGALIISGFQLGPLIQRQAVDLFEQLPSFFNDFQQTVHALLNQTPFAAQSNEAMASIDSIVKDFASFLVNNWQKGAQGIGTIFSAVSSITSV